MFSDEPVDGCLRFEIPLKPRSFQTNRLAKRALIKSIQDILAPIPYLFSGDVKIIIGWSVDEQVRYEGNSSPDVDNIIKPMLDAFSGPRGLMIDDCQVQSIECYWADTWGSQEHCEVSVSSFPDDWVEKFGLAFVDIKNGLCMPINKFAKPATTRVLLDHYLNMMEIRKKLELTGRPSHEARKFMSVQRVFHKSRLRKFDVYSAERLRTLLYRKKSVIDWD